MDLTKTALKQIAGDLIAGSRVVFDSGFVFWKPNAGEGYTPLYLRDFAMMVRGCPELFSVNDIKLVVDLFIANAGANGEIPDAINPNGTAMTDILCLDNVFELVDLLAAHRAKTNSTSLFEAHRTDIEDALVAVPVQNHLVYINPLARVPGWGFQDRVCSTGYELPCSLLRFRAYGQLSQLLENIDTEASEDAAGEALAIKAALETHLWNGTEGLFKNSNGACNQHSVVGSALAVHLDACSSSLANAIRTKLNSIFADAFRHGGVRHATELWDTMETGYSDENVFQNGGYWPAFTGWLSSALSSENAAKAWGLLLAEIGTQLAEGHALLEWKSGEGIGVEKYTVSAVLPLEALN